MAVGTRAWPGLAFAMLALGVAVAPWTGFASDLADFTRWAAATAGGHPWSAYGVGANYPPLALYVLAGVEAVRRALGLSGATLVLALKLPWLLAWLAGAPVCRAVLRGPYGDAVADRAAWLYVLALPLWLNAAVWGQVDAGLALLMLLAVLAAMRDRPGGAGVALGLALALKLQAIAIVPVLAIYAWRRWPWAGRVLAVAATALAWGLAVAPALVADAHGVWQAYHGAVGTFPYTTVGACNVWYGLDLLRGLGGPGLDAWPPGWPVTLEHVGLLALAAYLLALLARLWREPTPEALPYAAALAVFGFFMWPTQMHERYVVPAVALAVPAAAVDARAGKLYLGLCAAASLNQLAILANPTWAAIYQFHHVSGWLALAALAINLALQAHVLSPSVHSRAISPPPYRNPPLSS